MAYADDVTIIMPDEAQLPFVENTIKRYESIAGANINQEKSVGLQFYTWRGQVDVSQSRGRGIETGNFTSGRELVSYFNCDLLRKIRQKRKCLSQRVVARRWLTSKDVESKWRQCSRSKQKEEKHLKEQKEKN